MIKGTSILVNLARFWRVFLKKFSLPIAVGLSLTLFVTTAFFEPIYTEKDSSQNKQDKSQCTYSVSLNYIICKVTNSKVLEQVQNFSVILAACLYILSFDERKKQAERQAWQLIDGARGIETSGARKQALEELNEEGVSLQGLDADGADLIEIKLPKANLERANLQNALLEGADLRKACLYKAKLQNAKLQGANLENALLWGANLEGAELQAREPEMNFASMTKKDEQITNLEGAKIGKANLNKALLVKANLQGADLRGAFLHGADLHKTNLKDADINEANFTGAYNLDIEQVKLAKNWEKARYDKSFCLAHHEYHLLYDEKNIAVKTSKIHEESVEIKLLGLVHKLLTTKEIDKRKEIAEIRKKIAELIKLLDSNSSVPLLGNPLIEELTNAAERLMAGDEALGDSRAREAAEMREKVANLHEAVRKREEKYQEAAKKRQQAEMLEQPFLIAGDWLKLNYKEIRNEAIRYYLEKNRHTQIADGQPDSDEKLTKLETDIDEALLHISTSLLNLEQKPPNFRGVVFKLSFPIQSEVLQIICNDVIPKIANEQLNTLPEQARQILDFVLKSAITTLQ